MADKTGGAAFPGKRRVDAGANGTITVDAYGMTLRDYFAAKAMQGIVASISQACPLDVPTDARLAYRIADAMLAARGDA